jgi:hypothetical protein
MTKIILLSGIFINAAAAQPSVIRVIRNGFIQAYSAVGHADPYPGVTVFGMSAISGLPENWLIELHDSFASLEDLDNYLKQVPLAPGATQSDELLNSSRALIAVYRPGLSYRPDQAVQSFPKMRYVDVVIYRVRPGTEGDFGKFLKLRGFGQDSINLDRPDLVYQVTSGGPSGIYLVLIPLPSLRILDDGRANTPAYAQADLDAARKIAGDTEFMREHFWFRVEPGLSHVSNEFAADDSTFWHPER